MLTFVQSISDCLDQMIACESARSAAARFESRIKGDSWIYTIKSLSAKYASIADPDALALVPDLVKLFNEKAVYILDEYYDSPDLREKLFTTLSQLRKRLGFDERERKVKRK